MAFLEQDLKFKYKLVLGRIDEMFIRWDQGKGREDVVYTTD